MSKIKMKDLKDDMQRRMSNDYQYKLERDKIAQQLDEIREKKYPLSVLLTAIAGFVNEKELELKNAFESAPEHDCNHEIEHCPLAGSQYRTFLSTIVCIKQVGDSIMNKESVREILEHEKDTIKIADPIGELLNRHMDYKE